MAKHEDSRDCRDLVYVNGWRLRELIHSAGLDEASLATKADVSEQTVRNYLDSSIAKPRRPNPKTLARVCSALGVSSNQVQLDVIPLSERIKRAKERHLANPHTSRKIAGDYHAESVDLEIPGYVTYKRPIPWHGELTVFQDQNEFSAVGEDKDGDEILAAGSLYEGGEWVKFDYWVDNARLREYGAALAKYDGDGKTIEGVFVGRDAGHSSIGLVVAKITLRLVEARQETT